MWRASLEGLPEEGHLPQVQGPRSIRVVGKHGARWAREGMGVQVVGQEWRCYKLVNHWLWGFACPRARVTKALRRGLSSGFSEKKKKVA